MTYQDRLRIALQVLESGELPDQPPRLTRRTRQIVVAFDVHDDRAVVWFIRRAHGNESADETIRFERRDGEWHPGGGGGGEPGTDLLSRVTKDELIERPWGNPLPFAQMLGAGFSAAAPGRMPRVHGPTAGSSHVMFQAIPECVTITVSGRSPQPVPAHGCCLVVFAGSVAPIIEGFDANGASLGRGQAEMRMPGRGRGRDRLFDPVRRRLQGPGPVPLRRVRHGKVPWRWPRR